MAEKMTLDQEIGQALDGVVQYDLEKMFPKREGFGAKGAVRGKLKLVKNLLPALDTCLIEGETLIYVARGYVVNWFEQLFGGATVAYYANITCVVLTDRRILFVNTDGAGKQKHFRNQVLYTEVKDEKIKNGLSSSTKLKFKDGKALTMGGFKGVDRKKIQEYLSELMASMPADAPRVDKSVQYICPKCSAIYVGLEAECTRCSIKYKDAEKAARMSLMLPGLGDIYLGHTFFGVMELIGSLVEWFILVMAIIDVKNGAEGGVTFLGVWICIMIITNVMDCQLTKFMGKKGLIAA